LAHFVNRVCAAHQSAESRGIKLLLGRKVSRRGTGAHGERIVEETKEVKEAKDAMVVQSSSRGDEASLPKPGPGCPVVRLMRHDGGCSGDRLPSCLRRNLRRRSQLERKPPPGRRRTEGKGRFSVKGARAVTLLHKYIRVWA
jgi:hypothetical protein